MTFGTVQGTTRGSRADDSSDGSASYRGRVRNARLAAPMTVAVGAVAALVAAAASGALDPLVLGDPGPVVRWGIPALKVVVDLAAALTVGLLVLAAVALPAGGGGRSGLGPAQAHRPALVWASGAAGVWALATLVLAVLTYADVAGVPMSDPDFGPQLGAFLTRVDLGVGLLVTVTVSGVVSLLAAGAQSLRAAGLLALLSMVALIPPALSGHSASAGGHETAVTALGLHLLGVCVWAGGLLALVLVRPGLSAPALSAASGRFSVLALWSFAAVLGSGVISAWIRIGEPSALRTVYGALVMAKATLLVALGVAGWWHRRLTLRALHAGRPTAFWRLAAGELVVMATAIGLGVALARSPTPVPEIPPAEVTLAESLTGYPMPPAPTVARWFTLWEVDLLWLLLVALAAVGYLAGAIRLHRRGDRWPVGRTLLWLLGLVVLFWVTSGGPMVYGRVLFSAHMTGHMVTTMAVPLFLVLAAPITLALRALPARGDGTRGPREWLLAVTESPFARVVANPIVAATLFAGTLFAFYFSSLFPLALSTHVGHELMHLHFLASGYLFLWVLIGVDPGPQRPQPALRMLVMFVTVAFHAFFGVVLMMSTTVLAPEYFANLGRTWGRSLLADQAYGGGIAWGFGELPMLIVALILGVQWARSDERESRRLDRAADRDHDAQLTAYNAMLTRLADREADRGRARDSAPPRP